MTYDPAVHRGWNEHHFDTVQMRYPFSGPRIGQVFPVDRGVLADVQNLWAAGIETSSSCQGDDEPDAIFARFVMVRPADVERAMAVLGWPEMHPVQIQHWTAIYDRVTGSTILGDRDV